MLIDCAASSPPGRYHANRDALRWLGLDEDNIHFDHGLTGANR